MRRVDGDPPQATLQVFLDDARPAGTVVEAADLPPGPLPVDRLAARVVVRPDTLQVLRAEALHADMVGGAPGLVLTERLDREADPVVAEVVAFLHDDVLARAAAAGLAPAGLPEGTVLTAADVRRLGLTSSDQVAAFRWRPATGQALEVYVAPAHRRRRIATKIGVMAECFCVARGWPSLWAGGVRTALGEAFLRRRGWRWGRGRLTPLAELAPPMTPPDDAVGLPRHLLEPDD